jgi:hypothetical protein
MTADGTNSGAPLTSFIARLSAYAANALRYWEPRRLIYNGVLALVVIGHLVVRWPTLQTKVSVDSALGVFILAVLANVAYCAVYAADLFVQFSGLDDAWRRGRVILLIIGTAFAATITHFVMSGE